MLHSKPTMLHVKIRVYSKQTTSHLLNVKICQPLFATPNQEPLSYRPVLHCQSGKHLRC